MNKYFNHVWNPEHSIEQFLEQILADPDGFHFYDGSTEFEIGQWRSDSNNNSQWFGPDDDTDSITQKYNKVMELYDQRPDVKTRVVSHWGYHSMMDPINVPRIGEHIYKIFGKNYTSPLFFLLKTLVCSDTYDIGITPHETESAHRYGFPTIEKSLSIKPTQLFNFPMNRPHPHRINAFHAMVELDLVDKGYLGFCVDKKEWVGFIELMYDHACQVGGREYFEPVLNQIDTLFKRAVERGEISSGSLTYNISNLNTPDYNCQTHSSFISVFDIVSESTSSPVHFFTEKTFKSVIWGKPFVILGSPNQNKVFADMGFEPYSDFFDLSGTEEYFQEASYSIISHRGQIDAYKKVLKPLTQIDPAEYSKIKTQAMPTAKHNHDVMVKKIFSDDIITWDLFSDPCFEEVTNDHYSIKNVLYLRECLKQHTYFKQFCP